LHEQERLILSPMLESDEAFWPKSMAVQIAGLVERLEGPDEDGWPYSIDLSSWPKAEVEIFGRGGAPLSRYSTDEAHHFSPDAVKAMHQVVDAGGRPVGAVVVKLDAQFDWLRDAGNSLWWVVNVGAVFVVSALVMGLVFGAVAAKYVTSRLHAMNLVTEEWRRGKFDARIALRSSDELATHSQRLNHMAQELELLIGLKQAVAAGRERNRVARDLHDTVKQKLFALSLQLEVVKAKADLTASTAEHILEAEALTREAQFDLMEIITQLRPPATTENSLMEHIETISADFRRRFHVAIDTANVGSGSCGVDVEHHVIRIVQEALMNAIQHGKAKSICISTSIDRGRTALRIADDGVGFDTKNSSDGFGLVSMRDRAADLPQGAFLLESEPGSGVCVIVSWANEA